MEMGEMCFVATLVLHISRQIYVSCVSCAMLEPGDPAHSAPESWAFCSTTSTAESPDPTPVGASSGVPSAALLQPGATPNSATPSTAAAVVQPTTTTLPPSSKAPVLPTDAAPSSPPEIPPVQPNSAVPVLPTGATPSQTPAATSLQSTAKAPVQLDLATTAQPGGAAVPDSPAAPSGVVATLQPLAASVNSCPAAAPATDVPAVAASSSAGAVGLPAAQGSGAPSVDATQGDPFLHRSQQLVAMLGGHFASWEAGQQCLKAVYGPFSLSNSRPKYASLFAAPATKRKSPDPRFQDLHEEFETDHNCFLANVVCFADLFVRRHASAYWTQQLCPLLNWECGMDYETERTDDGDFVKFIAAEVWSWCGDGPRSDPAPTRPPRGRTTALNAVVARREGRVCNEGAGIRVRDVLERLTTIFPPPPPWQARHQTEPATKALSRQTPPLAAHPQTQSWKK